MSRVSFLDAYTQRFFFSEAAGGVPSEFDLERQQRINAQIDGHLSRLVGPENWERLKLLYALGPLRDDLIAGKLHVRGHLVTLLALDPFDHDQFHLDGLGRYFIVRETSTGGDVLLAGDFHLVSEPHHIDELNRGYIDVNVSLIITEIPGHVAHLHDANVRYRIFVDTTDARRGIYSIDYQRRHEVHLLSPGQRSIESGSTLIGHVVFDRDPARPVFIDMRGTGYVRQDYRPPGTGGANTP